ALAAQRDRATWPATTALFAARFLEQTRDEWAAAFAERDACVTPVLDMDEAPEHPQLAALGAFATVAGVRQPAPAPEFSAPAAREIGAPPQSGRDTTAVLARLGCSAAEIARLLGDGIARAA